MWGMEVKTDIALVGAGPLGIDIAVALQRAGLSYVHLEAGQIGATMQWWAPGTRWFSSNDRISVAGVPLVTPQQEKATREEYLAYLRSVVAQFGLRIETYARVTAIERSAAEFVLTVRKNVGGIMSGAERVYRVRKVILATGGTERANRLGIPGEDLPHVSHYFAEPHTYFGRRLLIVGGRNSAVEAGLRCHRAGAQVAFSYRGEAVDAKDIKYWLYPEFSSLVKTGKIVGHFGTEAIEITPEQVLLAQVHRREAAATAVPADFVLLLTGYVADMSLARMAGVELDPNREVPVFHPETMETNVPGVYVAGTAVAGTQRRYKVFLENCVHAHASRILGHFLALGMVSRMPAGFAAESCGNTPDLPES
jgi:thioredoxin reductase (NADPH)